ncbi:GSCOCG00003547001-RA-CDS [Cotesia congregata]|uniref:Similar to tsl: Torso-like protein (Drosophila melanogaster) n=1 Tax=Cotesia congregata TaxID=51543 RepID=A0A8J2MG49_COTCN|nr:GSCOCG00003547001-RA-CDS [Cotesia congregata]CAG5077688.1 Similar to tsl: Torso-like protein (Drosophila melanogaster) [Cotesia congregata]
MFKHKSVVLLTITLMIVFATSELNVVPIVGNSLNILKFHGILSLTMRVFSSDSEWIFRQPSTKVFKQVTTAARFTKNSPVFSGDFHIEMCENYEQLFQAYFRNFTIEGVGKPWRSFMASWEKNRIAKYFGIRESLLSEEYKYIFVRIARVRDNLKMTTPPESLEIEESILDEADNVDIEDSVSTVNFIYKYSGTHYIESYTSGDSLFQVFVYRPKPFKFIKRAFTTRGIDILFEKAVTNYFSTDFAEYVGELKTGSGNETVEEWASINLFFAHQDPESQNILRLYGNERLLTRLGNLLWNEALIQLNLKYVSPFFPDKEFSKWLLEFISNNLKLWDDNL